MPPFSEVETLCVAEPSEAAARLSLKVCATRPRVAFGRLRDFEAGKGFDEANHCADQTLPVDVDETLLFGCFPAASLLGVADLGDAGDAEGDPKRPLDVLRRHLLSRKPPVALLEVSDWDCIAATRRKAVLEGILDDPSWGLRTTLKDEYNLELLEVELASCGLPVAGLRLQFLLARKAAASQEK